MGSKIAAEIESDLVKVDTSTVQGFMDYSSINNAYYTQQKYVYKKLTSSKYVFKELEHIPFDILLAINPIGELKAIQIKLKSENYIVIKNILDNIYGKHTAEVSTEYSTELNDVFYSSFYWSCSDFEISYSDSEICIYYPKPKAYIEKLLQKSID